MEGEMATHSRILIWKTHRQRSLAGHSAWGRKESDTAERARAHTHTCIHTSHFPKGSWMRFIS